MDNFVLGERKSRQQEHAALFNAIMWTARKDLSLQSMDDTYCAALFRSLGKRSPFTSRRTFRRRVCLLASCARLIMDSVFKDFTAFSVSADSWTDVSLRKFVGTTHLSQLLTPRIVNV